jgi:hypothetical protein
VFSWRFDQLAPQALQPAHYRGRHLYTPPSPRRSVEHGPHERQAALLTGEPTDHLHPAARLAEGALYEVRVPDALSMLLREPQVGDEMLEAVF